ncbi:MAG: Dephospho-CoA kinase [Chlamydiia bacterium]|nr:Dephospho-CoA kinase [Chlamydiia bacterium]
MEKIGQNAKIKLIAVTGGVSSGKSTVLSLFQREGAYVVSADELVHQLLSSNSKCQSEVLVLLGDGVLTEKEIDRKKVAERVFDNPTLLTKLENILHEPLLQAILQSYQTISASGEYPLIVVEVPLLFELGWDQYFDHTIAIKTSLQKAKERSPLSPEQFDKRSQRQLSINDKLLQADTILPNDGDLDLLKRQVTSIYQQLIN